MTVKDLIEALSNYDPDIRVVVSGYEGGLAEISRLDMTRIILNYNDEWYYGQHEPYDIEDHGDRDTVQAIHLRR